MARWLPPDSTVELVSAGQHAWDLLLQDGERRLVARDKISDAYLAGKVLERWLRRCAANRG
jgi:hypothetical protein